MLVLAKVIVQEKPSAVAVQGMPDDPCPVRKSITVVVPSSRTTLLFPLSGMVAISDDFHLKERVYVPLGAEAKPPPVLPTSILSGQLRLVVEPVPGEYRLSISLVSS